jgi:molybdopterin/thiamine biosynthesis adenylyltransferase
MTATRYRRHEQIDWFSQDDVHGTRVLVVGAGAVGNEVVKNLVLLGTGAIDVCDFDTVEIHNLTRSVFLRESDVGAGKAGSVVGRAAELDPNVTLRAIDGDAAEQIGVSALQQYRAVICAVDNFEARVRLNQLCLLARVNFVNAGIDSRHVVVESYPFADSEGAEESVACYECHLPESAQARMAARYSCGGLRRRAQTMRAIPTTAITASVAGALAASTALRLGQLSEAGAATAARRVLLDTIGGSSTVTRLSRNEQCPACDGLQQGPIVLRVRNRWLPAPEFGRNGLASLDQVMRLSDPIVTGYQCAACGPLAEAERYVNHRAAEFDDSIAFCPQCAEPAVRVEIRQRFELRELLERFGNRPVPVRFALATIGGRTVCFDFDSSQGGH